MSLHALTARFPWLLALLLAPALALVAVRPARADDPPWFDLRPAAADVEASAAGPWLDRTAAALAAWQSDALAQWTVRATEPAIAEQRAVEQGSVEAGAVEQGAVEQPATPRATLNCHQISAPDEIELILTDADLLPDGAGTRLCLYWDARWANYNVLLLNQRSADEFRRSKAQLQPLLNDAGIDPCLVGFWSALDSGLRRTISLQDQQDAGRRCDPQLIAHGQRGEERVEEVNASIMAAVSTAETAFRWPLTWPLRVHLYDDRRSFFEGVRVDAGDEQATPASLRNTFGLSTIIANGMMGFLVDISNFPEPSDLRMLASHEYAHIAQAGALGTAKALPYFAIEGGAEYFASLVVGTEQRDLADRYQQAVNDERRNRVVPLSELIALPDSKDERRAAAGYSRGYAAMRFLTTRWGEQAFTETVLASAGGTPDRFVTALTRITGMNLDGFDRALSAYLREGLLPAPAPSSAPTPSPASTPSPSPTPAPTPTSAATPPPIQPGSLLTRLVTARPAGTDGRLPAARFSRADSVMLVLFDWSCLNRTYRGQAHIIAPNGAIFASFDGTVAAGCGGQNLIEFNLDQPYAGQTARSLPGTWRVEITADNAFQGSVTFIIE